MGSHRLIISILFLSFLIYGCSSSNEAPPQEHRDDLIVIEGARDIKYYNLHGTEQVYYRVDMAYPAGKALIDICKKLKARGWEPLPESFLNPGLPSSHVKGWDSFIDGTKPGDPRIHQWMAEWKNINGDIVWYALRYESRDKKSLIVENNKLLIYAAFVPASLAKADREVILKKKPASSKK